MVVCIAAPAALYGIDRLRPTVWIGRQQIAIDFQGEAAASVSRVRYGWLGDNDDTPPKDRPLEDHARDVRDANSASTGWAVQRTVTGWRTLLGRDVDLATYERIVLEVDLADGASRRVTLDVPLTTGELTVELRG